MRLDEAVRNLDDELAMAEKTISDDRVTRQEFESLMAAAQNVIDSWGN